MSSLASKAEVLKLTRLLGADITNYAWLESFDALAIRALREQMTAKLYDSGRGLLQKVAAAAKLTPTGISAFIAEKALGPLLCARVASLLPAEKAIDISKRLSPSFLAEVCLHLDPRRVHDIIRGTPVPLVVAVSGLLESQQEFVTMARFVDALTSDAIKAVMESTADEETLLRIGFFVENPAKLDELVSMMPADRLRRMVAKSVLSSELYAESLGLMSHLSRHWKGTMGQITAELDEDVRTRIVAYTQERQLWATLLPIVAATPAAAQQVFLSLPALDTPEVLASIKDATGAGFADTLKALLPQMPTAMQKQLDF